jgi:FtsZ-binding cell division protein ZapB
MENTDNQTSDQAYQKPKSNKGLTILLFIVIVALAAGIVVLYTTNQRTKTDSAELQQVLEEDKKSLQKELGDLIGEYDALKTNNDSMNKEIAGQQERIKSLLKINSVNAGIIKKYRAELTTLRDVLRSYIVQVDSLNTRNQQLVQENVAVKTNLDQARTENVKISQEKDQLNSQVQKASVITTSNLVVTPLNKRGKEENKLKNMLKLKVCFTMRENSIAKPGTKEVFVRITRPDGAVITYSQTDVFDFQGQQIVYSAKREVEYENKDIDVCIFWDNNNQLVLGEYTIDIFTEGNMIGTTKFTIKK